MCAPFAFTRLTPHHMLFTRVRILHTRRATAAIVLRFQRPFHLMLLLLAGDHETLPRPTTH